MFYKMVFKIYFHKHFWCNLANDKNTKLSLTLYFIDLKTCLCTAHTESVFGRNELTENTKAQRDLPGLRAASLAADVRTAGSETRETRRVGDTVQKISLQRKRLFRKHEEVFKRKIIVSTVIYTGK